MSDQTDRYRPKPPGWDGLSVVICRELCDEERCPDLCGLPANHDGEHACTPPDAGVYL